MTWDKTYVSSYMAADNGDSSVFASHPDDPKDRIDDLLEEIKTTARRNRDPNDSPAAQALVEGSLRMLQACRAGVNPARVILEGGDK